MLFRLRYLTVVCKEYLMYVQMTLTVEKAHFLAYELNNLLK